MEIICHFMSVGAHLLAHSNLIAEHILIALPWYAIVAVYHMQLYGHVGSVIKYEDNTMNSLVWKSGLLSWLRLLVSTEDTVGGLNHTTHFTLTQDLTLSPLAHHLSKSPRDQWTCFEQLVGLKRHFYFYVYKGKPFLLHTGWLPLLTSHSAKAISLAALLTSVFNTFISPTHKYAENKFLLSWYVHQPSQWHCVREHSSRGAKETWICAAAEGCLKVKILHYPTCTNYRFNHLAPWACFFLFKNLWLENDINPTEHDILSESRGHVE